MTPPGPDPGNGEGSTPVDRAEADATHRSKIDAWILVAVVFGFVVGTIGVGVAVVEGQVPALVGALLLPFLAALFFWPLSSTRYVIGGGALRIRCGPFRWTIPVETIREVKPSRNPLSAPAASLDRLRIDYAVGGGNRMALVSPRDKQAFLEDLRRADPGLRLESGRLTRG